MKKLSPLFVELIAQKLDVASNRKISEWLGLDNALDAEMVADELKREPERV